MKANRKTCVGWDYVERCAEGQNLLNSFKWCFWHTNSRTVTGHRFHKVRWCCVEYQNAKELKQPRLQEEQTSLEQASKRQAEECKCMQHGAHKNWQQGRVESSQLLSIQRLILEIDRRCSSWEADYTPGNKPGGNKHGEQVSANKECISFIRPAFSNLEMIWKSNDMVGKSAQGWV